jgi:hypothetical protein
MILIKEGRSMEVEDDEDVRNLCSSGLQVQYKQATGYTW